MSTPLRTMTRASVDQAEPLSFSADDHEPVQVNVRALDSLILADVEKRIGRLLEREGWNAPTAAQEAPRRAGRPKVEPIFQPDGTPCCPSPSAPAQRGPLRLVLQRQG